MRNRFLWKEGVNVTFWERGLSDKHKSSQISDE